MNSPKSITARSLKESTHVHTYKPHYEIGEKDWILSLIRKSLKSCQVCLLTTCCQYDFVRMMSAQEQQLSYNHVTS